MRARDEDARRCACVGCASCRVASRASASASEEARTRARERDGDGGVEVVERGATASGSTCANEPQRYVVYDARTKRERTGSRRMCKPCLRRRETERKRARADETRGRGDGRVEVTAREGSGVTATSKREVIVLFGDSLTERSFETGGFGARLQHEFRRFADVRARGFSGYNTSQAATMLEEVFPLTSEGEKAPVLVTVLFGSNDACDAASPAGGVQHVPVKRYEENLRAIARHVQSLEPRPRLLFIAPPPVDDVAWARDCATRAADPGSGFGALLAGSASAPNRTTALVKPYVEAMKRVARSMSIPIIDLFEALRSLPEADFASQFVDGLHFSETGQRRVASLVLDAVRTHFPRLASMNSDAIKCDYPDWKHLSQNVAMHADEIASHHGRSRRLAPADA